MGKHVFWFLNFQFWAGNVGIRVRTDPRMFLNVLEFEYFEGS